MRFAIANQFNKSLDGLDKQSQNIVKQTVFDYQRNPDSPGFKLHRVERARDNHFWSARVSRDIRIIVHKQENTDLLCYVGHHDAAYDWAQNRRLEVHPDTGAAQMVEIKDRIEEVIRTKVKTISIKPPLFSLNMIVLTLENWVFRWIG